MLLADAVFVVVYATLFAMLEIEIEGPHGWAKNLPTKPVIGKYTGYHCIMNVMVPLTLLYFMWPKYGFWTALFFIVGWFLVEDFSWFALNPAYTVSKYSKKYISWHGDCWPLGIPLHNYIGVGLMVFSIFMAGNALLWASGALMVVLVGVVVLLSPLYRRAYESVRSK